MTSQRIARLATSVALVIGLLGAVGCSSAPTDGGSDTTTTVARATTTSVSPEQMMAGLGDLVPGEGPVRACVINKLNASPDLLPPGHTVTTGSPAYAEIQKFIQSCTNSAGFGEMFVDLEVPYFSASLSPGQRQCLRDAFAALPQTSIDDLLASGVDPPADSSAAKVIEAIESGCRLERETRDDGTVLPAPPG